MLMSYKILQLVNVFVRLDLIRLIKHKQMIVLNLYSKNFALNLQLTKGQFIINLFF